MRGATTGHARNAGIVLYKSVCRIIRMGQPPTIHSQKLPLFEWLKAEIFVGHFAFQDIPPRSLSILPLKFSTAKTQVKQPSHFRSLARNKLLL